MKIKLLFYIVISSITLYIISSCSADEIILDKVRYIPQSPDDFQNNWHWGKSIKAMQEKNEFIFVTGKIDTTSEIPPIEIAFISINRKTIQLNLIRRTIENNQVIEKYSGNGYDLLFICEIKQEADNSHFSKGHLIIKKKKIKSEYEIFGEQGYY
ncbi:MAG: hypothetical protein KGL19_15075 [Bacteroidota bacterium]|nr:hypothetical protein [Bacteroidota bacterium]